MLTVTNPPTTDSAAERFLADVRTKNQDFYATDRGYGALKDLQQTFPQPWLYVGELLQNAVDADAKHIRLSVDEAARTLVVEHDGRAFNEGHVEALCVRGMSKKGAGAVGFMGIGFKAVFQRRIEVSGHKHRLPASHRLVKASVLGGTASRCSVARRQLSGHFCFADDRGADHHWANHKVPVAESHGIQQACDCPEVISKTSLANYARAESIRLHGYNQLRFF